MSSYAIKFIIILMKPVCKVSSENLGVHLSGDCLVNHGMLP